MYEDVVHRLQVEALLDLREGSVEQVGQCHEVQQQAHRVDYVVRRAGMRSIASKIFADGERGLILTTALDRLPNTSAVM